MAAAGTTPLPAGAATEAEHQQTGTNNNCSVHRKPSHQQCLCINIPFLHFLGTGIMGQWNGDTDTKNKHTNKKQQWCVAATCTHLQSPHQNHPFSQLRAARLKLSERKELNNGMLEWGHKKPTHQQAATMVCGCLMYPFPTPPSESALLPTQSCQTEDE